MGLTKSRCLKNSADYRDALANGVHVANAYLSVYVAKVSPAEGAGVLYGISVSRRIGGAVLRNKIKRRIREQAKEIDVQGHWKVVIIVRKKCASASSETIKSKLMELLAKGGLEIA